MYPRVKRRLYDVMVERTPDPLSVRFAGGLRRWRLVDGSRALSVVTPHTLYAGVDYGRGSATTTSYFVREIRRAHGKQGTAAQAA